MLAESTNRFGTFSRHILLQIDNMKLRDGKESHK